MLQPGCQPGAALGTYELALGDLPDGTGGTAVFGVAVDPSLPGNVNTIYFQAALSHDGTAGADLNPTENTDSASTPLISAEDILRLFLPAVMRGAGP